MREVISTDSIDIRIIRQYYEQHYAKSFNNLDKMQRTKNTKAYPGGRSSSVSIKAIEPSHKETPGPDVLNMNSTEHLRRN